MLLQEHADCLARESERRPQPDSAGCGSQRCYLLQAQAREAKLKSHSATVRRKVKNAMSKKLQHPYTPSSRPKRTATKNDSNWSAPPSSPSEFPGPHAFLVPLPLAAQPSSIHAVLSLSTKKKPSFEFPFAIFQISLEELSVAQAG